MRGREVLAILRAGVHVRWHRTGEFQILRARRARSVLQPLHVAGEQIRDTDGVLLGVGLDRLRVIFR